MSFKDKQRPKILENVKADLQWGETLVVCFFDVSPNANQFTDHVFISSTY